MAAVAPTLGNRPYAPSTAILEPALDLTHVAVLCATASAPAHVRRCRICLQGRTVDERPRTAREEEKAGDAKGMARAPQPRRRWSDRVERGSVEGRQDFCQLDGYNFFPTTTCNQRQQ